MRVSSFFFTCYGDHRDLHSFPTRRSSDLSWDTDAGDIHAQRVDAGSGALLGSVLVVTTGGTNDRSCSAYDSINSRDRKSTRLNSSRMSISYAVFCLKKKKKKRDERIG